LSAAATRRRDAWLSNRPDAVMATLTTDALLLPSGMNVVRRQADGSWKITHRMWSDRKGP
jgi:hypothetical protein